MSNNRNQRRGLGLGRPRLNRRVRFDPMVRYFKPQGIPLRELEEVSLSREEIEALRLKNIPDYDQTKCAEKMNTSQSTFQRILSEAYKKISIALVEGKAIKIEEQK
jgi:predicted DNA-binding protein (UPF0251 family)